MNILNQVNILKKHFLNIKTLTLSESSNLKVEEILVLEELIKKHAKLY